MDIWHETNWFAVQTKPSRENVAAGSLAQLDVEVFLPKVRQEQLVCGVARMVTKPLFCNYLFGRFCPVLLLDAVRYACGVLRVVSTSGLPLPLEAGIIES